MKKFLCAFLAVLLLTCSAEAAVMIDAPGTPTWEKSIAMEAVWMDEAGTSLDLAIQPVDQEVVDMTVDIFNFVYEQGNRPARWYPEEAQKAMEEAAGVDLDTISMTEMSRVHIPEAAPTADLKVTMESESEYLPGQPVVIMLGATSESGEQVWSAYTCNVPEVGKIEFVIPKEDMEALQGSDMLFSVMAQRSTVISNVEVEEIVEEVEHPSKTVRNITRVIHTIGPDGEPLADAFQLVIVPETEQMLQELAALEQHVAEEQSALTWLPEETQNQIRYLLGNDVDALILSDYIALKAEGYEVPGADAVGSFAFAAPYAVDQKVVSVIGMPGADGMEFIVQPVIPRENETADVVFNRSALGVMGKEACLLLVFSEPVA